jgi:hypothetical protein
MKPVVIDDYVFTNDPYKQFVIKDKIQECVRRWSRAMEKRLDADDKKLSKIIRRKNPFIYLSFGYSVRQMAESIVRLHIEESIQTGFGHILQKIAKMISSESGKWLTVEDMTGNELDMKRTRLINDKLFVDLEDTKSGPSWGNSKSIRATRECFERFRAQETATVNCIIGHAYKGEKRSRRDAQDPSILLLYGKDYWDYIGGVGCSDFLLDNMGALISRDSIERAIPKLIDRVVALIPQKNNKIDFSDWL